MKNIAIYLHRSLWFTQLPSEDVKEVAKGMVIKLFTKMEKNGFR